MKRMKKAFALMLAMVMVMAMAVTSFATEETGSITINGVSKGNTYKIYKLLELESYSYADKTYDYEYVSAWESFIKNAKDDTSEHVPYFTVDEHGVLKWNGSSEDARVVEFAAKALAYAKDNTITPDKTLTITDSNTIAKFEDLPLGYYLVDSSAGALCGLTTTNPNASINAKNGAPTVDKQVMEDSTQQWGASNSADIGQIVEYRVTVTVAAGAEGYVLHDAMEPGLTFVHDDDTKTPLYPGVPANDPLYGAFRGVWAISHVLADDSTELVDESYYTVKTGGLCGNNGCGFEVEFSPEFCKHLDANDKFIVHYNVMLNRYADTAESVTHEVNKNSAWLSFGEVDTNISNIDHVFTRTHSFDIVKTDDQNDLLDGAIFKLYNASSGGSEVAVVPLTYTTTTDSAEALKDTTDTPIIHEGKMFKSISEYRRARADETGVPIVVCTGQVKVVGFDNGHYYLEEIKPPAGYNELTARKELIISNGNLDALYNDGVFSTGSGVHVVNHTGAMLPETGGMGTVMFITCGSIVVMAAGVLLVTKKRMSMIQD